MRVPWLRWMGHPAVVRAGGLWALLRHGRVALALLRDERVPAAAKLIVPAALLYVISPIDVLPDLVPLLGQVDDVSLLVLSLIAFVKMCPPNLVAEHERRVDGAEPVPEAPRRPTTGYAEPVEAQYRWVDDRRR